MKRETYIKLIGTYIPLGVCSVSAILNGLYILGCLSIVAGFIVGLVAVAAAAVYFRTWHIHGREKVSSLTVLAKIMIIVWIISAIISGVIFLVR